MVNSTKQNIVILISIFFIMLGGWGLYTKQVNLMLIGLIIGGLIAFFKDVIIKWF